ncbi:MAG: HD domain-containing protein [Dehalococcoidia bacterium]
MIDPAARTVDAILELYLREGNCEYFGEPVTQLEHALQCAHLAAQVNSPEDLVIAALLHDIGHLSAPPDSSSMEGAGVMDHESIGGAYLRERGFSEELVDVIGGHVAAKRYLVARNREYGDKLSEASIVTLRHQGGPMSEAEADEFESQPRWKEMLRLRIWDDQAKRPGLEVPPLESYRDMMTRHLRQGRG